LTWEKLKFGKQKPEMEKQITGQQTSRPESLKLKAEMGRTAKYAKQAKSSFEASSFILRGFAVKNPCPSVIKNEFPLFPLVLRFKISAFFSCIHPFFDA
jgi:hypothetical protein